VKGMGGAMDLVAGVRRVAVVMEHVSRSGSPKIRSRCSLPLTGAACVDLIITDLAVFGCDRKGGSLTLLELAPETDLAQVVNKTEATFDLGVFA